MENRIHWIDVARALAILLIVFGHIIGHCDKLGLVLYYIQAFHVPIFFVISVFLFKTKEKQKYKGFVWQKFKRIMVPYFVFGLLFLVPYFILGSSVSEDLNINNELSIGKSLLGIIYGNGHDQLLKQNSALWFLPCLFIMYQIFYFIDYLKKKIKKNSSAQEYIIFLLLAVLGVTNYSIPHVRLPWGIDIAISLSVFFELGSIIRNIKEKEKKIFIDNYFVAVILLIIGGIICFVNKEVSCMDYFFGNYWLFLLSALSTIVAVFILLSKLPRIRFMEEIGKQTMGILIFHKLIVLIFQTKLGGISTLLKSGNFIVQFGLALVALVVTVAVCYIPIILINRFCPFLLGNSKKVVK